MPTRNRPAIACLAVVYLAIADLAMTCWAPICRSRHGDTDTDGGQHPRANQGYPMTMPDRDNVLPLPRRDGAAPRRETRAEASDTQPATNGPGASDKLVPAVVFQVQRLRRQLTEGLDLALDASREIRDSFAQLQHHLTTAERRALTDYVTTRLQMDQHAAALHQAAQRSIRDGDLAEMERIRDALVALMSASKAERQTPMPAFSWSQLSDAQVQEDRGAPASERDGEA